ncbi:MAG TPA: hypothetical protein VNT00_14755 [Eoetvoesiella sp.]|uniref:hypothetical protein n=1 Tax=Eoetvoesiella sp. TaxID=1966355 RepID=UPI002B6E5F0F|nr:hypothetical protein [Eoetvoesiella sp.]HWK62680.1 hypothetical protein [Eoetvoesiella sp.]
MKLRKAKHKLGLAPAQPHLKQAKGEGRPAGGLPGAGRSDAFFDQPKTSNVIAQTQKPAASKHRPTDISKTTSYSNAVVSGLGFDFPTFGAERAGSEGSPKGRTSEAMRCSARGAPNRSRGGKLKPSPGATDQKRSTPRIKNTRHHQTKPKHHESKVL